MKEKKMPFTIIRMLSSVGDREEVNPIYTNYLKLHTEEEIFFYNNVFQVQARWMRVR
jgi:hypothetical protein